MINSLATQSMDTFKRMFNKCIHTDECKCNLCLPLHLQFHNLTAEAGLELMSEYCFNNGASHLGVGIQQSIWSATHVG